MQYTHKKSSALVRFLFLTLIGLGFIIAFIPFTGLIRSIMSTVAILCILGGMMIFMKYEATVYSVVINARETDFDFFINKSIGKRGSYICYFYISDALKVVKYDGADSKDEISKEYNGIVFHSYVHNLKSRDRYAIIFKLDGRYDALVVELNNEALSRLNDFIEVAKAVGQRHTEVHGYGSDDDENEIALTLPSESEQEAADTDNTTAVSNSTNASDNADNSSSDIIASENSDASDSVNNGSTEADVISDDTSN